MNYKIMSEDAATGDLRYVHFLVVEHADGDSIHKNLIRF